MEKKGWSNVLISFVACLIAGFGVGLVFGLVFGKSQGSFVGTGLGSGLGVGLTNWLRERKRMSALVGLSVVAVSALSMGLGFLLSAAFLGH